MSSPHSAISRPDSSPAGDRDYPHCRNRRRYPWVWTHRQSFAARREYHWVHHPFPELSAKRLELLERMVPGMSRVAAFWDPTTGPSQPTMSENAARSLKLKLQIVEVRQRDDVVGAFRAARDGHAEALNVFSSPILASLYREIIDRAAEYRLPAIYQWKEHTEAGGLMSYGPDLREMYEQTATIVVKILKGAKPADLPVEQPARFELVINLKTAKALGLAVSPSLLATADEVIE